MTLYGLFDFKPHTFFCTMLLLPQYRWVWAERKWAKSGSIIGEGRTKANLTLLLPTSSHPRLWEQCPEL